MSITTLTPAPNFTTSSTCKPRNSTASTASASPRSSGLYSMLRGEEIDPEIDERSGYELRESLWKTDAAVVNNSNVPIETTFLDTQRDPFLPVRDSFGSMEIPSHRQMSRVSTPASRVQKRSARGRSVSSGATPDIGFDQPILQRLIRTMSHRDDVVPFIGAGLSVQVGYPGWTQFLLEQANTRPLHERVFKLLSDGFYEEAAESLAEGRLNAFIAAIETQFESSRALDITSAAFCVPRLFKGPVVTTNFDNVLERVYRIAELPFDILIQGAQGQDMLHALQGSCRALIKLHGQASNGETRVLTRSEYTAHYCNSTTGAISYRKVLPLGLRSLMSKATFLFIGCSLNKDRYLDVLAHSVNNTVNRHYAIIGMPAVKRTMLDLAPDWERRVNELARYHIDPIWYPEGQHRQVRILLEYIASKTSRPVIAKMCPSHPASDRINRVAGSVSPSAGALDLLRYINARMRIGREFERLIHTGFDSLVPGIIVGEERRLSLTIGNNHEIVLSLFPKIIQENKQTFDRVSVSDRIGPIHIAYWPNGRSNRPQIQICLRNDGEPIIELSTEDDGLTTSLSLAIDVGV